MDNIETQYALLGSVDEVKLWNVEIPPAQIMELKNQWPTDVRVLQSDPIISIYPNPADRVIHVELDSRLEPVYASLFSVEGIDMTGYQFKIQNSELRMEIPPSLSGIFLLRVLLKDGRAITRKIIIR
jgi:hypothetical protein